MAQMASACSSESGGGLTVLASSSYSVEQMLTIKKKLDTGIDLQYFPLINL